MQVFKSIPQIDLMPLADESDVGFERVARDIREAYTKVGFAYIYNHGFPQDLLDSIFEYSRIFHALPLEEKMQIHQNKYFRGYMPVDASILKVSTLGEAVISNQSAAFIHAFEVNENHQDYLKRNLAGPNQWPAIPGFKEAITQYNEKMLELVRKIVRVFAVAFNMPRESLNHYFINPTTFLRLQYYPEQPNFIPKNQFGIAPHTDYGFCTILAQDNSGGLQVRNQIGEWIDAPPVEGTFVLNSSDMLKRMTNDTFISTPHRVINHSGKPRYSIPFFFEPDMYADISPLPIFCKDAPSKYSSIIYHQHLMKRIKNNYEIGA